MFNKKLLVAALALVSLNLYAASKDYENGKILTESAAKLEADKQTDAMFKDILKQYNAANEKDKKAFRESTKQGVKENVSKIIPARISPEVALIKFTTDKDTLIYTYQLEINKKDLEKQVSLKDLASQQQLEVMPEMCGGKSRILLDIDLNINYVYLDKKLNKLTDITFTKQTCNN